MRRVLIAIAACALCLPPAASADPASYVRPLSGTLGSGFPMVGASVPFGLIQPGPDTGLPDGSEDPVNYCGYGYQDPTIRSFSLTHFDGAGIKIGGDVPFMPVTGTPAADAQQDASPYEHATEVAEPGYYAVTLAKYDTRVELTSALRSAMARVSFPAHSDEHIVVDPARSISGAGTGTAHADGDRMLVGTTTSPDHYTLHFAMQFDQPFRTHGDGPVVLDFDAPVVTMRTAISYVDANGALRNLGSATSFDAMRKRARAAWNERLRSIEVSGGSAELTRTFYSNLYRFFLMPSVFDDADGRYLGMDGQVHTVDPGTHQYTALSLWDTYRTEFPLLGLIAPDVARDVARSILNFADQNGGMLPRWVQANRDQQIMGGDSATATLGDAVGEGLLDNADGARAYRAMLDNAARVPHVTAREGIEGYMQRGWVGQDEQGRSGGALTLEYAIDDAAMLPALREHGTPEEVAAFTKRAGNWRNLWSATDGFLRPRNKDGSWASPNPLGAPGVWRPEFQDGWQEGTGYQYLWFVPHDVPGLVQALGGNDAAAQRLDDFFRAPAPVQDKGSFFGVYYVGTQFTPSNETDLWVPWYYNWLGQPWKAQREVRQAMSVYSSRPDGMPGNDDTGTMSAWYVLAALGLYHAAPGSQAWELSSPAFPRAVLHVGGKRRLTIDAPGASQLRRYVQSATLDRKPFERTWLSSDAVHAGARLAFVIGTQPNRSWASGPQAAPPGL
ncbi:MAG TPA: GH92 family glycosyl hydrolase [Thermoleophilaceae bacterium]|nr:GH92 family glycosyl hydrolase [Thermoleophilaceae bacterium]